MIRMKLILRVIEPFCAPLSAIAQTTKTIDLGRAVVKLTSHPLCGLELATFSIKSLRWIDRWHSCYNTGRTSFRRPPMDRKSKSSLIRFLSLIVTTISVFWGFYMWLGQGQTAVGVLFVFALPLALIAAVFYHRRRERRQDSEPPAAER
jgi:hypothetical protein